MRLPTITVAGVLWGAAILTFDMAAVELLRRGTSWPSWEAKLLLAVLPSINMLAIGLYLLARQLSLRGEGTPFLVGFEAAGWPAVAAALIAKLGFDNQMVRYERWAEAGLGAIWQEYIMWTGGFTHNNWAGIKLGFDVFALAAPQLLLALFGGWAAARLGVVVVRGSAPIGRPRAIPARRATAALVAAAVVLGTGVWAAKIRGRWLVYRLWADAAVQGEPFQRRQYKQILDQIQSLDQNPGEMADDPAWRAEQRKYLVDAAERSRRWMEQTAAWRKAYEPAARRPWLPIPPNPPLNPLELEKPR
jgi:hypothetical protein